MPPHPPPPNLPINTHPLHIAPIGSIARAWSPRSVSFARTMKAARRIGDFGALGHYPSLPGRLRCRWSVLFPPLASGYMCHSFFVPLTWCAYRLPLCSGLPGSAESVRLSATRPSPARNANARVPLEVYPLDPCRIGRRDLSQTVWVITAFTVFSPLP